ncbi:hypothetical protein ISS30_04950 [bacterium]|nr:hypothetical protein [FCB group bacterium]MBL7191023.1 hypothetical protein [bacterium]
MKYTDNLEIKSRLTLHPRYIVDEKGSRIEAVIPYQEFKNIQEAIEDILDIMCVESRRGEEGIPIEKIQSELV